MSNISSKWSICLKNRMCLNRRRVKRYKDYNNRKTARIYIKRGQIVKITLKNKLYKKFNKMNLTNKIKN